MNVLELTEFLVKSVIKDTESLSIKEIDDEEEIVIEVLVASEDMGSVIGKGGSIINAIRTIVQASSYANNNKHIKINVDSL